jgi:hypothetical protein
MGRVFLDGDVFRHATQARAWTPTGRKKVSTGRAGAAAMPQHRSRPCGMKWLNLNIACECRGRHRQRPWFNLLGYVDKAGRPIGPEYELPKSSTRCQDGTMRLCEAHVQRLERYRAKIQGPNGEGVQPVAVQVAILLDAVAVTDRGAAPRPWSELVATTELPSGMVTSKFATPEQREIYTLKRKIVGLESQVAKLQRELSEARGAEVAK